MKDIMGQAFANAKDIANKVIPDAEDVNNIKEKAQQTGDKFGEVVDSAKVKANDTVEEFNDRIHKLDKELETSIEQYNMAYTAMNDCGMSLFILRNRTIDLIDNVAFLINSIANHPKAFDTEFKEIMVDKANFKSVCDYADEEVKAARQSAESSGAGLVAGAGVACLAPTAAMWIATTFGTASTGAAISTLSGAAATNAALAWLGGGTIVAGGGGVAAGDALLALSGPVGWGIAGATILTSIVIYSTQKGKRDKAKNKEIEEVKNNTASIKEMNAQLDSIVFQTTSLRDELGNMYNDCLPMIESDFNELAEDKKSNLGALVNNTKALSALLGKSL